MNLDTLPVAVIGAGPVGLAAAAHLDERGIPFVVFEVGDDVAASIRDWAHVQLFSPWSYNIDPAARRLLTANGWLAPTPTSTPPAGSSSSTTSSRSPSCPRSRSGCAPTASSPRSPAPAPTR